MIITIIFLIAVPFNYKSQILIVQSSFCLDSTLALIATSVIYVGHITQRESWRTVQIFPSLGENSTNDWHYL